MVDIAVPRLNTNDTVYCLVEWLVEDGAVVRAGDPLAVLESSKAAQEIEAHRDGVVQLAAPPGADYPVGHVIGRIFDSARERRAAGAAAPATGPDPAAPPDDMVVTVPARALATELGIDDVALRTLGRRLIRRTDVEELARAAATDLPAPAAPPEPVTDPRLVRLPANQVAVAAVVSVSHATIPAAFSVIMVDVDAALAHARRATRRHRALIGLTELFVKAVGRLHTRHPMLFASFVDPGSALLSDGAHVGLTVDVGTGLFVPVVRDAHTRSLADVARATMEMRKRALKARFRGEDLSGATVMVAVTGDEGVLLTQPVILPGLTCAVSLGSPRREVVPDAGGDPRPVRTVLAVGLAYDHRLVNGRAAVAFLTDLRTLVENPEDLDDD